MYAFIMQVRRNPVTEYRMVSTGFEDDDEDEQTDKSKEDYARFMQSFSTPEKKIAHPAHSSK